MANPVAGYAREYCVAGVVWHAWCAVLLLLAAAIRSFYETDLATLAKTHVVMTSVRPDIAPQRPQRPLSVSLSAARSAIPVVR